MSPNFGAPLLLEESGRESQHSCCWSRNTLLSTAAVLTSLTTWLPAPIREMFVFIPEEIFFASLCCLRRVFMEHSCLLRAAIATCVRCADCLFCLLYL